MSERHFRTATIHLPSKINPVTTLTRTAGETFKEFVQRAEAAAGKTGKISENYRGKPGSEEAKPKAAKTE